MFVTKPYQCLPADCISKFSNGIYLFCENFDLFHDGAKLGMVLLKCLNKPMIKLSIQIPDPHAS